MLQPPTYRDNEGPPSNSQGPCPFSSCDVYTLFTKQTDTLCYRAGPPRSRIVGFSYRLLPITG